MSHQKTDTTKSPTAHLTIDMQLDTFEMRNMPFCLFDHFQSRIMKSSPFLVVHDGVPAD
jgi:hypothetical protein